MAEAGHDWSLQVRDLVKVFNQKVRANDGIEPHRGARGGVRAARAQRGR